MTDIEMIHYTRQALGTIEALSRESEKRFRFGCFFVILPVVAWMIGMASGESLLENGVFPRLGYSIFPLTGLGLPIAVLLAMALIQRRKNAEWQERRSALLSQMEYHLATLRATTAVNEYYWHPQVLDTLELYLARGLASNLAECYKMLHQDQQHQALLAQMDEIRRRMRHGRHEGAWGHFPFHAGHEREHEHHHHDRRW